jgi:hypothetical protein
MKSTGFSCHSTTSWEHAVCATSDERCIREGMVWICGLAMQDSPEGSRFPARVRGQFLLRSCTCSTSSWARIYASSMHSKGAKDVVAVVVMSCRCAGQSCEKEYARERVRLQQKGKTYKAIHTSRLGKCATSASPGLGRNRIDCQ